ncbi:unnamed protein product [Ixodes pacificus]
MADMNDPPPLFSSEGDLNSKEDDDIFASTVEQHKNFREGPMEGPAVEEVNLDEDEPQTQAPLLGSAKLEFRGSDEELSAPAPNPPRGATTLFSPDAGAKPQAGGKDKEVRWGTSGCGMGGGSLALQAPYALWHECFVCAII